MHSNQSAFNECLQIAENGDASAQFNLALKYETGDGVSIDMAKAFEWYFKSASQGHSYAQTNLGLLYCEGRGVQQNVSVAYEWYQKAASQSFSLANYYLGQLYEQGTGGVSISDTKAFEFYLLAANQGSRRAQVSVGTKYEKGVGVAKDERAAYKWYQEAASQHYSVAQCKLATLLLDGRGIDKDESRAFSLFQQAAAQQYVEAQYYVGMMYEKGISTSKNDKKAAEYYQLAANQGSKRAQLNLGIMYEEGRGVPQNDDTAADLYYKAACNNYDIAQYRLALMYTTGRGVKQDSTKAAIWLQNAAEQEHPYAQFELAGKYEHGIGVDKDERKAVYWYQKASMRDSQCTTVAEERVQRILSNPPAVSVQNKEPQLYQPTVQPTYNTHTHWNQANPKKYNTHTQPPPSHADPYDVNQAFTAKPRFQPPVNVYPYGKPNQAFIAKARFQPPVNADPYDVNQAFSAKAAQHPNAMTLGVANAPVRVGQYGNAVNSAAVNHVTLKATPHYNFQRVGAALQQSHTPANLCGTVANVCAVGTNESLYSASIQQTPATSTTVWVKDNEDSVRYRTILNASSAVHVWIDELGHDNTDWDVSEQLEVESTLTEMAFTNTCRNLQRRSDFINKQANWPSWKNTSFARGEFFGALQVIQTPANINERVEVFSKFVTHSKRSARLLDISIDGTMNKMLQSKGLYPFAFCKACTSKRAALHLCSTGFIPPTAKHVNSLTANNTTNIQESHSPFGQGIYVSYSLMDALAKIQAKKAEQEDMKDSCWIIVGVAVASSAFPVIETPLPIVPPDANNNQLGSFCGQPLVAKYDTHLVSQRVKSGSMCSNYTATAVLAEAGQVLAKYIVCLKPRRQSTFLISSISSPFSSKKNTIFWLEDYESTGSSASSNKEILSLLSNNFNLVFFNSLSQCLTAILTDERYVKAIKKKKASFVTHRYREIDGGYNAAKLTCFTLKSIKATEKSKIIIFTTKQLRWLLQPIVAQYTNTFIATNRSQLLQVM